MSTGDRDVVARMLAAAAELRRRVQTVHERVACPRCGAGVGTRCRHATARSPRELRHAHRERLRADGIADR